MSKQRIQELQKQLLRHQDLYYNHQPEITDAAYDALFDELLLLDPKNPAITKVGAPINSEWKKAKHSYIRMGSLDKAQTPAEMEAWIRKSFQPSNSILYMAKLDGISLLLIYQDGKLQQAITRGDGTEGELITRNAIRMQGVKTTLLVNFTGALRGEIIIKRSVGKQFFPDAPNLRNMASGVAKRLDGQDCDKLNVLFYQMEGTIDGKELNLPSEFMRLKFMEDELGLEVPHYEAFSDVSIDQKVGFMIGRWEKEQQERAKKDFEFDGLVVALNDLQAQEKLGWHKGSNRPHGKIAFKFQAEEGKTTITKIVDQVGKGGRITPVVEIEPVNLAGAMISRASLYNYNYIQEYGVDVGAEVSVIRSNEVIPVVKKVITSTKTIHPIPKVCPACGGKVEFQGVNLQCLNASDCPAQISGRILNWLTSLDIKEFGEELVNRLIGTGLVEDIVDLYHLSVEELAALERMGEKSAQKCHDNLWAKRSIPLTVYLGSLSIPGIAVDSIQMLVDGGLDDIDKILKASAEDFAAIKGFGKIKSQALHDGLKRNAGIIDGLFAAGLAIEDGKKQTNNAQGRLNGKIFVLTGEMSRPRKELEGIIKQHGGNVKGSVGKGVDFLIIADPSSTSVKANKARQLGTQLISEMEFLSMVS